MLANSPVFPSIRVKSIKKVRDFYVDKLGLKAIYEKPGELLVLAGNNSRIYFYEGKPSVPEHTVAVFYVNDIYKIIDALNKKGVKCEQYDFGENMKTDKKGVIDYGGKKGAWIKDPEGHVLGLSQLRS